MARSLGRIDESLAIMKYAVARDPVNPRSQFSLGLAYFYAGQPDEAIASMRTVLMLSPGSAPELTQLIIGTALREKGEYDAALAAVQAESHEGLRLAPGDVDPQQALGVAVLHAAQGRLGGLWA